MILGISGFINSGKGTVSNYLVTHHGWKAVSFADALKDSISAIFRWPRHLLEGDTVESRAWREVEDPWWSKKLGRPITPRFAMQHIGTDVMRAHFDDRIWILSVEKQLLEYNCNTVVTDIRFKNEMQMVRSLPSAYNIWVRKNQLPDWYNIALDANSTFSHAPECAEAMEKLGIHKSEWDWIGQPMDYVIHNDGTLHDLYKKVDIMLSTFNTH